MRASPPTPLQRARGDKSQARWLFSYLLPLTSKILSYIAKQLLQFKVQPLTS